jgi:hypothetical protein
MPRAKAVWSICELAVKSPRRVRGGYENRVRGRILGTYRLKNCCDLNDLNFRTHLPTAMPINIFIHRASPAVHNPPETDGLHLLNCWYSDLAGERIAFMEEAVNTVTWKRTFYGWAAHCACHNLTVSRYRRGSGRGFGYVARLDQSAATSPAKPYATADAAKKAALAMLASRLK